MSRWGILLAGLLTVNWSTCHIGSILPVGIPADNTIVTGPNDMFTVSNYAAGGELLWMNYGEGLAAAQRGEVPQFRHNAAVEYLRHAPGRRCWGDARGFYDTQRGKFVVDTLAWDSLNRVYGFCIGVGTASANTWAWTLVPFAPTDNDGARISYNDTQYMLLGVNGGPAHICNKDALAFGSPICTTIDIPLTTRIPLIAEGGTGGDLVVVGQDARAQQLVLDFIQHPTFTTIVSAPLGSLAALNVGSYVLRSPGRSDTVKPGITLKDSVIDWRNGKYWVSFEGKCPQTGDHQCVGAFEIAGIFPPVWVATYWFDSDDTVDGMLPSLTVDADGVPWMNWVEQGPSLNPSMEIGQIPLGLGPGTHVLSAVWKQRAALGTGTYPGDRNADFTGIDHRPGAAGAFVIGFFIDSGRNGRGHVVSVLR